MKQKISETVKIPQGVSCSYHGKVLSCTKDSKTVQKELHAPNISIAVHEGELRIFSDKANKNDYKKIASFVAHAKSLFAGLGEEYIYQLEAVNVHFPMTLKKEGSELIINNFLGEKKPRKAKILAHVNVDVKGTKITISSPNRELAGQTAANFERATKVRGRDRRIFQDGIFITSKPGRKL